MSLPKHYAARWTAATSRDSDTVDMLLGGPPKKASTSAIPFVTEHDFEAAVLTTDKTVLVQFTADWCAPCKQIAPEVEALADEMAEAVSVVRVDIDKSPMLARQLRVQSVPTFMVFAAGRVVDGVVGAAGKKQLKALLEPHLPRPAGSVKVAEAAQLVGQGHVVPVDVRETAAFGRAHLPRAASFPADGIEERVAELYMLGATPMLYCRSGSVAPELVARLVEQGVELVYLEGGMLAWEAAGLPVERP